MAGTGGDDKRRGRTHRYRRAALCHPLRRKILRSLLDERWFAAEQIAADQEEPLGRTLYQLKVLHRRQAVVARARGPRRTALYRIAPEADWVRKMLDQGGEFGEPGP